MFSCDRGVRHTETLVFLAFLSGTGESFGSGGAPIPLIRRTNVYACIFAFPSISEGIIEEPTRL